MEIIKTNNIVLPKVEFSKEQLATFVKNDLAEIDENLEPTKKRALVNKIIAHYDEQRKDITRMWDDEKKRFMSDVKDALKPAVDLKEALTAEINAKSEKEKAAKLEEIKALPGFDFYSQFFEIDEKWLNKTTSIDDIAQTIEKTNRDMIDRERAIEAAATSHNLEPSKYVDMLKKLHTTEDIIQRITEDAELLKSREPKEEPKPSSDGKKHTVTLVLSGTIEQLTDLKAYMAKIGVEYKKVTS